MNEVIGEVTHFFAKAQVAVIKLANSLRVGDTIHIKGATTDFNQRVSSMQQDHQDITEGKAGDEIGMKMDERVREGDEVLRAS